MGVVALRDGKRARYGNLFNKFNEGKCGFSKIVTSDIIITNHVNNFK